MESCRSRFNKQHPAAGEIVFASTDYDYINNIANRKDVDPDGLYDVVGHGIPYKIKFGDGDNDYYTPRELARILKHRKDYKKNGIRLLPCNIQDRCRMDLHNTLQIN
ncbi:MAG: hypothetical protein SOR59_01030 [Lachnospiraceae bacterium]|nr:hypothetical protein [Lachnospiraceae bacterium]